MEYLHPQYFGEGLSYWDDGDDDTMLYKRKLDKALARIRELEREKVDLYEISIKSEVKIK